MRFVFSLGARDHAMAYIRMILVSLSRVFGIRRRTPPAEIIRFRPYALR
jgi:hypothetical protein